MINHKRALTVVNLRIYGQHLAFVRREVMDGHTNRNLRGIYAHGIMLNLLIINNLRFPIIIMATSMELSYAQRTCKQEVCKVKGKHHIL